MYASYKDGVFRELVGNIEFSPTVYQTPESLTPEQRAQFSVYFIVDEQPALPANHVWSQDWVYDVIGADIKRTWTPIQMTPEQIAAQYAASVPQVVTMRQSRLALLAAGLLDLVETAIAAAGPAAKIEWDYATEVQRASGLVPAMATALGLTDAQIDALFVSAATL